MESNKCIFCSIGENIAENNSIILENELAFAIPDIKPVTKGHSLIITKKHFPNFMECDDDSLQSATLLAKQCAQKLLSLYPDIQGFNYVSNQGAMAKQVVFHLHIHVIPRYCTK